MGFVFEKRRMSGSPSSNQPDYPAVRITRHKEGKDTRRMIRLYFAFTPQAIKAARWIGGDRVTVGCDVAAVKFCFKRDPQDGFTLGKGKGNVAFQISADEKSDIWIMSEQLLGEWIRLKEDGGMLFSE